MPMFQEALRRHGSGAGLVLEPDPRKADLIILWEGFQYKTPDYIRLLENNDLIRDHAERVFTINYDDHPEGFLAGVYTSLESPFYDPRIHRIWPFFLMNNPRVYDLTREEVLSFSPKHLFCFTGAASRNRHVTDSHVQADDAGGAGAALPPAIPAADPRGRASRKAPFRRGIGIDCEGRDRSPQPGSP